MEFTTILALISSIIAVPSAYIACIQIKSHYVLMKKEDFRTGQADKVYARQTKPILSLFNHYLIKKIPMKRAVKDAGKLARIMMEDNFYPTIIVGIGRGGAIFGSFLSYNLYQAPMFGIDRAYKWQHKRKDSVMFDFEIPPRFLDKVLLVSGEVHSGNTMDIFEEYLLGMGAHTVKTCTFYQQNISTKVIDYNLTKGTGIPFMPWQDKDYKRDSISADLSDELLRQRSSHHTNVCKTIYLLRHSETVQNAEDVFIGSGTEQTPLTPNGKKQATSAGRIIRNDLGQSPVIIHCSPQKRCTETAGLLSKSLNAEMVTSQDLMERNFGDWEGMTRNDLIQSGDYRLYETDPVKFCPPHAEEMTSAIGRAIRFLGRDIIGDEKSDNHIVVTHKTTGRILLSYMMNIQYSKYRTIKLDNDSIVKITLKGDDIKWEYLR